MNSRMEKHYGQESLERSKKNKALYESIYDTDIITDATVKLQDNEKVIDMKKVNEMVQNREEYIKQKKYKEALSLEEDEEEEQTQYDIYADIESRIFDINMILENAKKQRDTQPGMKKRIRNTQYDILNKLNLKEMVEEVEEEDQAFFSKEGDIDDLFHQLKGNENTVVTRPVREEEKEVKKENDTFYTSVMSFTKDDFEELKDLKKTVKRNNRLIKVLTTILILALLAIAGVVVYNMFFK